MLSRLSVNMNVFVESFSICSMTRGRTYNLAQRIFGYLGNWTTMLSCLNPLNTPTPTILTLPSPSGGVKEPSM